MVLDAADHVGAATIPGAGPGAHRRRRRAAADTTIERVETELGWEFIQIYGLTETAPLLTMNRTRAECDDLVARRARRASSAGPVRRRSACAMRGRRRGRGAGPRQRRARGLLGAARGQTDAAIDDGWFHTGDGGIIDDDDYVTISDRKKDVIITGGENVSSIEVEDALFQHPAVAEVAVIGVPDEKWGETVKALVVPAPGSAAHRGRADRAVARTKLAHYKCPNAIEFRDELARTATGKLQKFKLREPYWSDATARSTDTQRAMSECGPPGGPASHRSGGAAGQTARPRNAAS